MEVGLQGFPIPQVLPRILDLHMTADMVVNNTTTQQRITDLSFAVGAFERWHITGDLYFDSAAANGFDTSGLSMSFLALPQVVQRIFAATLCCDGATNNGVAGTIRKRVTGAVPMNFNAVDFQIFTANMALVGAGTFTTLVSVRFSFSYYNGPIRGTLFPRFAQGTADASNLTLLQGSAIRATLLP